MARVLDDALRLQPAAAPLSPPVRTRIRPGLLRRLALWLAGFGVATAGLTAAAAAGVLIGLAQPASLVSVGEALEDAIASGATIERRDLMPSLDVWFSEG